MNNTDIKNKSDRKSLLRSLVQPIQAKLYKVEDNKIYYTVTSSEHNKQYLVTIQLLDLASNKLKSLQQALSGNLRISCTCPAFSFYGFKYISYKAGVGIEKETRSPDIRNPNKEGLACKHILLVLNQLKRDYSKIYNLYKDVPPDDTPKNLDDNASSNEPTEFDLKIIEDFQSACDKLYKAYIDYKNTDTDETFIKSKFYDGTDPSKILLNLSKPVSKSLNIKFIGKCKTLNDIINLIETKGNSFNILLDSDIKALTRKLNSTIKEKTESLINNIILNIIGS